MVRWIALLLILAAGARADEALDLLAPDGSATQVRPESGEHLVVHFWATWCPSCIEDIASLQEAADGCADARVRILLVDVGDDELEIGKFAERHAIRLPIFRDPKGEVWRGLASQGLPANLFWSPGDRRVEIGPKTPADWRSALGALGCAVGPHGGAAASPARSPGSPSGVVAAAPRRARGRMPRAGLPHSIDGLPPARYPPSLAPSGAEAA